MTLLYCDPVFLEHQTGDHPENSGRIASVDQHMQFVALHSTCKRPAWEKATVDRLCYVHSHPYVDSLKIFATNGGGYIERDTIVSEKSFEVARMAVGAVCDAVERVIRGEDQNAFCMVRPPGHHAMPDHAMGFCLFNNIAIGAQVAIKEFGIERALIVDFDVHHGNGTQATFWENGNVGYFSMHRSHFYPGTGNENDIGAREGTGTTLNLPISYGTPREDQLQRFENKLNDFANKIKPQLLLVSAGFDSHKDDPIGSLGLESEDFRVLTRCLLDIATEHTNGKLVSVLEGGYNPQALTDCISIHLEELLQID